MMRFSILMLIVLWGLILLPLYVHFPLYICRFFKMRKIAQSKGKDYAPSGSLLVLNLIVILSPAVSYVSDCFKEGAIVYSNCGSFVVTLCMVPMVYMLAFRENRRYREAMAQGESTESSPQGGAGP